MNSLVRLPLLQSTQLPLTEAASLRAISALVSSAKDLGTGLAGLAETVLRVPALHKVQITPSVPLPSLETLEWYASRMPVLCGSARAFIEASGRTWGRLDLYFEPRIQTVESPLRLARFLGQQAALLLNRFAQEDQLEAHLAAIDRLQRRLETRKAVHRAAGILAQLRGVSDREALALLFRYARESRRTLASLADAIILGNTSFRQPFSRPIQRNEPAIRTRLFA